MSQEMLPTITAPEMYAKK